jgi:hypothetical protein
MGHSTVSPSEVSARLLDIEKNGNIVNSKAYTRVKVSLMTSDARTRDIQNASKRSSCKVGPLSKAPSLFLTAVLNAVINL